MDEARRGQLMTQHREYEGDKLAAKRPVPLLAFVSFCLAALCAALLYTTTKDTTKGGSEPALKAKSSSSPRAAAFSGKPPQSRAIIAGSLSAKPLSRADPLLAGLQAPGQLAKLRSRNRAAFEGGNIGLIRKLEAHRYELHLRSDNDDALPKFWRRWFYLEMGELATRQATTLRIRGAGHWNFYVPVFSYDNKTWEHFPESTVRQVGRHDIEIRFRFKKPTVYLARFHPYTYTHLLRYLERIEVSPYVRRGSLGDTPEGRSIPFFSIGDPQTADEKAQKKARIFLHARTHPGEVGSSFLLEGLVDFLMGDSPTAKHMRQKLIFDVVPMLNVDGVVAGNNRVTTRGVNLEGKWRSLPNQTLHLDSERVPEEVVLFHAKILSRLDDGIPTTMALNLHSSNGEPEDGAFFFPHFGPRSKGYSSAEQALFTDQLRFIRSFMNIQGHAWFNAPPADGTRSFLAKDVPEAWWWKNFGPSVMALSVESTYGRAPVGGRWIRPQDMRHMGASMAKAIGRYHGIR